MKATFEIQWLKEHRPNRQRPAQTLEVEELRVGSGAKADVRIGDRLVAGLALKLRPALGGLSIEPIDLFAGAFLNGVPVAGHEVLEPGGALQLGQALLELKVPEPAKFVLSIDEGYLDHAVRRLSLDPATKESATLEHDGPPEASWGRDPVLVRSMAGALGLALVLSFWLGMAGGGGRGGLAAAHADAKTADGYALGSSDGCLACHDGSTSSKKFRCAECHHDQVPANSSHPPASAPAEKTKECADCHREHRGRATPLWNAVHATLADAQREPLLPGPAPKEVCAGCHGAELPARKLAEVAPARDRARPVADVALQFESFSHAKHLHPSAVFESGTTPTCATCHQQRAADGRSFATVTYESCLGCHKGWRLEDTQHGRDSGVCADCHEKAGEKGMKSTAAAPAPVRYAFEPQDHPVTKEACAACHVSGKVGSERRVSGAPFRHDHHLPVFPDGALDEESSRTRCTSCHANVRASKSLADLSKSGRLDVDLAACSKCHKGNATVASADARPGSDGGAGSGPRADIVHRAHVAVALGTTKSDVLARGCFSCHVLASDGVAMGVDPKARACADCHAGHQRISCAACHRDLDPVAAAGQPPRCEKSVIDAKLAVVAKRGGVEKFDHFSPNHGALACDTCHAGVDTTTRLKQVGLPEVAMAACVRCHVIARFHR